MRRLYRFICDRPTDEALAIISEHAQDGVINANNTEIILLASEIDAVMPKGIGWKFECVEQGDRPTIEWRVQR